MPQPALPTFDYRLPQYFVVRIGTGTGTVGVLGQVKSVSGRTTANRNKQTFPRVGSSTIPTAYSAADYESTCDILLYAQGTPTDYLAATGDSSPATLDVANTVTIRVEVYNDAGSIAHSWQLPSAAPVEAGFDIAADGDAGTTPLRFTSASVWTKTTGS